MTIKFCLKNTILSLVAVILIFIPISAKAVGFLKITKNTKDLDETFIYEIKGPTQAGAQVTTVNNTGSIEVELEPGEYAITENPKENWKLDSASCDSGEAAEDGVSGVVISDGQFTDCTFTNSPKAVLEIIKNTKNGDGTFGYSIKGKTSTITKTITTSNKTGSAKMALEPGRYTVLEDDLPLGWKLDSNSCSGPFQITPSDPADVSNDPSIGAAAWKNLLSGNDSDDSYAKTSLYIEGDDQTYAVSNYFKATGFNFNIPDDATIKGVQVEIEKVANNIIDGSIIDNKISLVKNGNIENANKAHLLELWPKKDTIAGYGSFNDLWNTSLAPKDINSSDFGVAISAGLISSDSEAKSSSADANIDSITITVTYTVPINVPEGKTTACVFHNTRSSLKIVKNTEGGDDTFKYYIGPAPLKTLVKTFNGKGSVELFLNPGKYSVTEYDFEKNNDFFEINGNRWILDSLSCDDKTSVSGKSAVSNITLSAGQTVICTFKNIKQATLKINKKVSGFPPGPWSFRFSYYIQPTPIIAKVEYSGGEMSTKVSRLDPRIKYTITENIPYDYVFDSAFCDNGKPVDKGVGNVKLSAGVTTNCTFTNNPKGMLVIKKITPPLCGGKPCPDYRGSGAIFKYRIIGPESHNIILVAGGKNVMAGPLEDTSNTVGVSYLLLAPGNYNIIENSLPNGWRFNSASCKSWNGTNNGFLENGIMTNVDILPGLKTTCEFINNPPTGQRYLKIVKNTKGGDDTFKFKVLTVSGVKDVTIQTRGGRGSSGLIPVPGGGYITEIQDLSSHWLFGGYYCEPPGSERPPNSLDFLPWGASYGFPFNTSPPGHTTTCYFLNYIPGYLNLKKESEGGDSGFLNWFFISYKTKNPNNYINYWNFYNYSVFHSRLIISIDGEGSHRIPIIPGENYYITEASNSEYIELYGNGYPYSDLSYKGEEGWLYDSAHCRGGTEGSPVEGGVESFGVQEGGQTTNCVFKNTLPGPSYLKITANTTNGDDTFAYYIEDKRIDIKTTDGTGTSGLIPLYPGKEYRIHQSLPLSWKNKSFTCGQYQAIKHTPVSVKNQESELTAHSITYYSGSTGSGFTTYNQKDWLKPENASADDNAYATLDISYPGYAVDPDNPYHTAQEVPKYLEATNFGFNIPKDAVINGIQVDVKRRSLFGNVLDGSIKLTKNKLVRPINKGNGNWPFDKFWPAKGQVATYGGSKDLWGTYFTPGDVNSPDFGVVVSGYAPDDSAMVDQIKMTVFYTSARGGNLNPSLMGADSLRNDFIVAPGQTVNCVYENIYDSESGLNNIKIFKSTTNIKEKVEDGVFNYNVGGFEYNIGTIGTIETIKGAGSTEVSTRESGLGTVDYNDYITELAPSGWKLASASCLLRHTSKTHTASAMVDDPSNLGTVKWLNPSDAAYSDDVYSTAGLEIPLEKKVSHYLKATSFGFNIPIDAVIQGIEVKVEKYGTQIDGGVIDSEINLIKNGKIQPVNKADKTKIWPAKKGIFTYGSKEDLWGVDLIPNDVNSTSFGVAISGRLWEDHTIFSKATAGIDQITMTVTYATSGSLINKGEKTNVCNFVNKSPFICEDDDKLKSPRRRFKFDPEIDLVE